MDRRGTPRIDCALDATMALIGGRWKAEILCKLHVKGDMRFNRLMKELEMVSPKILTKQLREMEGDGLITRTVYPAVPACVEYSITPFGRSLAPALSLLAQWGVKNMFRNRVIFDEGTIVPARPAARP
ncbi:MAG: helix-turn-helix transcriptional regulator [Candidatus Methanoplasma sp.]|jgi:DNA-binding HxlR family transcriptional regulator|nr:helix-turn-helix transcriptional regulator [Candidatus Methanoplasma sp.]